MTMVEGDAMPAVSAVAADGTAVSLDGLALPAVVYFYPKDDTPGCTREALDFSALSAQFAAAGVGVVGVSKDSAARHAKFAASRTSPSNALAERMGCALEETPMGIQLRTDAESRTSVAGVFACGDVARVPHSVSLAVGSGAMTGAQVHRSLVWPETFRP